MVLEAALLFGILLLLPLVKVTSIPFLLFFAAVVFACLPVIRLVVMHAPPFVPTQPDTVRTMVEFAGIERGQRVYDLGCGDGRLLIAAARLGADAVGYELSVPTWMLAKLRTFRARNIRVRYGDFWKKTYGDADIVFCYLLPSAMQKFERVIWPTLPSGCRVVSHLFPLPGVKAERRDNGVMLYVRS